MMKTPRETGACAMAAIILTDLRKDFLAKEKEPGLLGSMKAAFAPHYRKVEAVRGISFSVDQGEVLAFIGPNGAGKSTTIKMLTGILYPSGGDATVLGLRPWVDRQRLAFQIGSVFGQKSQLWYHLPAADTFDLLARVYELPTAEYRQRRDRMVDLFDIGEFLKTPVRKLSLGQRMRCEIAASLLHRPSVLFLDEPTIGLDVVAKQQIRDLIRAMNREEGVTVFLTSHDAGDIERLCKRVIIINHGQVVMDAGVNTLRHNYLHNKVIDLKLAAPVADDYAFPLAGVTVVKARGYGLKLEVDTAVAPMERVLGLVVEGLRVADIAITDPPVESIIKTIYEQGVPAELREDAAPEAGWTESATGDALC